jgi:undecaprenyl-diphosphatase
MRGTDMVNIVEIIKGLILGIIQGITEWLPISSTGHLILTEHWMPFKLAENFGSTFIVVIQVGSILAVVLLFFNKLNPFSKKKNEQQKKDTLILWSKILVASIPAAIIGLLFNDVIDQYLYTPTVVAAMLVVYALAILWVERRDKKATLTSLNQISYKTAALIGGFQVLALIPGTSRSGATILGAILLGTSRIVASEFSFFMAIPVMLGAGGLKLLKAGFGFTGIEWFVLFTGFATAFIVSLFAIRFLLKYIRTHDFTIFAYYRIALAVLVLTLLFVK